MRSPTSRRGSSRAARTSGKAKDGPLDTLRFLVTLAILAWLLRALVVAPFSIPSASMQPALYIGDYLVVAKWPYGYSRFSFPFGMPSFDGRIFSGVPRRGDVVVFRHPVADTDVIKRVIGLPGDTVAMRDGRLILNGRRVALQPLPRYALPVSPNSPCRTQPVAEGGKCPYPAARETLPGGPSYTVFDQVTGGPGDDLPLTRVPAGHLFMMGDNRDDSLDSRFPVPAGGVGMLPIERLIGRATLTFWSTDGSASYFKPWTWFTALRADRIGNSYSEDDR